MYYKVTDTYPNENSIAGTKMNNSVKLNAGF